MTTSNTHLAKLLTAQLSEVYFFENQLVGALKFLADAAHAPELKELFLAHRQETMTQVSRLESAFAELREPPRSFPTCAVNGLMEDGRWTVHTMKDDAALDTALIAAAQKTEALEIATYKSIIQLARQLGKLKVVELCESNMDEETAAATKLCLLSDPFGMEAEEMDAADTATRSA